jgi:hypothetical protein
MNWNEQLQTDEVLVWQGKPAPRCYTLRNWPHSMFGVVLLLACAVWFFLGLNLESDPHYAVYSWLPVPFLLAGLYLTIGHLLIARLEWESVYYAISDRRLLVQQGLWKKDVSSFLLKDIIWFRLQPFTATLGSVSVRATGEHRTLVVACIEYPRQMTDLLEAAMVKSGVMPAENRLNDSGNSSSD